MFRGLVRISRATPWLRLEKIPCLQSSKTLVSPRVTRVTASDGLAFYRQSHVPQDNQSILLPGSERIRTSRLSDDPYQLISAIPNADLKNVYETLKFGQKVSNDGECLGKWCEKTKEFTWIRYSDVCKRTEHLGSGLINFGLKPCSDTLVGVFATNRIEFLLSLYGCAGYSMVVVPLYNSLGKEAVRFIINQAGFPLIICDNDRNAIDLLEFSSELPTLRTLVMMGPPSREVITVSRKTKINILTFKELEESGQNNKHTLVLSKPNDLFCIPYTSGTTGMPKGVMLTHENILSCVSSLVIGYGPASICGGTIVSYLPPAHIYEIMNEVVSLFYGRRICFYNGDIKKIFEFFSVLKPTIVPLVPRLMNALYTKVVDDLKSEKLKRYLMNWALSQKEKMIKKGKITNKTIWDKFILKKFQDYLGGEIHLIITTSAPISRDVMRFFRCASGCYVFEGYGQTEVLASNMTIPFEFDGGFVGPPLPCNFVKLVDIPEMGYYAKDDVGEVAFKGMNVFKGYFKNQEATNESFDKDGWHHSGDIGQWLPNGVLKIIDRKKHIFKLSQGEYIAPEKVENVYSHSPLVSQIYVEGLSDKDFLVAIILPDPSAFDKWTKHLGFLSEDLSQLKKDKEVRKALLKELHEYGKAKDLNALEQARNICLISEPFSVENDLLTPTFKLRRNKARKYFESTLIELYEEGPLILSTKS